MVRAPDLLKRDFFAERRNELWWFDSTYVPTWSGMAFTEFVADTCSRRLVGRRTADAMPTELPLDEGPLDRERAGQLVDSLVPHSDAGSQ